MEKQKAKEEVAEDTSVSRQPSTMSLSGGSQTTTPSRSVNALLESLKSVTNALLVALPQLMVGQKVEDFVSQLSSLCAKCPALEEALECIGFDAETKKFKEDSPQWFAMPALLLQKTTEVQKIMDDMESLGPVPGRVGRPFGSKGRKRVPSPSPVNADAEAPAKKSATKSSSSKKRKGAKNKKQKPNHSEEEEEAALDPDSVKKKLFEEYEDPFASDMDVEENSGNKAACVPLYKKCLAVELGKRLQQEGNCRNIEKEVMGRFKNLFWNADLQRWKTGLLCKWTKTLSPNLAGCVSSPRECFLPL